MMDSHQVAALTLNPRYFAPSAWWQHVPIAHWLIARLKPERVVELGSHYGVSFFAFCEAAQSLSPDTFIYAIDCWEGDEHAGKYGEEVYEEVLLEQERHHRERSRLIRSSFDAAASHFNSASIDLLHIDGLHTYEAVRHDLDTWMPKLRTGATILFHDTNVRERDFGVWQLWQEVQADDRFSTLEVLNGHGLGIATLITPAPDWHRELVELLPLLRSRGGLLDELARLRPEGNWNETDTRPYGEQARIAKAEANRLKSDMQHIKAERDWFEKELQYINSELEKMRKSNYWKLTAPLRRIGKLFQQRKK